jgi:CDP-diacylglycerol--serine O-phosphatidyltransferase
LAGLFSALLAIYFAFLGNFSAAMIGLLWAIFFDWSDGVIARKMKGRTTKQREFGAQFDSLIDIISFGVCPAVLLLSYGNFGLWFLPGAFIILAAGVLRLSYFNVFGLVEESTYRGLSIDNNGIILTLFFLLEGLVSKSIFCTALYILVVVIAALNVAPINTPKLTGRWFTVITIYTLLLSMIYGWKILTLQ